VAEAIARDRLLVAVGAEREVQSISGLVFVRDPG
jgi:hypothetical protein